MSEAFCQKKEFKTRMELFPSFTRHRLITHGYI